MRSIAHFSIRICAEASQIPRIQIPSRDLYSCADAELEVRRACLSVKRFGMEVNMEKILPDTDIGGDIDENGAPQEGERAAEESPESPDLWREGAVYYEGGKIRIRAIREPDPEVICAEEVAQGWIHQTRDKYDKRIADHAAHRSISMVAEYEGSTAGYINVYPDAPWGPFGGRGWCEIVDFGVLAKYRRRGIGTALMDCAEKIAGTFADTVYLAVGLHGGYGSAQRMYCRRGYIPDGSGVWYHNAPAEEGAQVYNDDELNLYFSKRLR